MGHHIGLSIGYTEYKLFAAVEVGDEHLDGGTGVYLPDGLDGLSPVSGAVVWQVVSVDGGDDHMFKVQVLDGAGHVEGFFGIRRQGFAGICGAEPASSGADVTEDHEGGSTCCPAFGQVGAPSALADGMETVAAHQVFQFHVFLTAGDASFEPWGFSVRKRTLGMLRVGVRGRLFHGGKGSERGSGEAMAVVKGGGRIAQKGLLSLNRYEQQTKGKVMGTRRLFLLDAMALIYRAYFAMSRNPRINSKGQNTSAILGFVNTLQELIQKERPTHLGVVFDSPGPTFRHEMYVEYKATRDAMPEDLATSIPYIRRLIEAYGIPMIEMEGYEADDLIGTLASQAESAGYEVFMMTPDKDFGQLVTERIRIYKPARMGNGAEILGPAEVCGRYGISRPEQLVDILALWGDASDNIPGIPGIGEKTASSLIAQYGTVEELLARSSELKGKQRENVERYGSQGLLSKELARIVTDAPVTFDEEALLLSEPDRDGVVALFDELEFRTLKARMFGTEESLSGVVPGDRAGGVQTSLFGDTEVGQGMVSDDLKSLSSVPHSYHLVDDEAGRLELLDRLMSCRGFCFDTETTGLDTLTAELIGIAFAVEPGEAWFLKLPEDREEVIGVLEMFRPVFETGDREKTGHNLKFDVQMMLGYGIRVKGPYFDTMLAHYLLQPETRHNMDFLAEGHLGYSTIRLESLIGKKGKGQGTLRDVATDVLTEYACEDADITLQLAGLFRPRLTEEGSERLYRETEAPLLEVLAVMERNGVKVDVPALQEYSRQLTTEILEVEERVFGYAGVTFNIGSPKQLGEILFDRLKISPSPKKTKTRQYSTGEEVLSKLLNHHPIVADILDYRSLTKLKSTYVDVFPQLIHPVTGRVHTSYNQAVTATGRLSSNNPNLQNIPIRTERGREIRKAFIAGDTDRVLVAADYSQIELRIIAHLSGDEAMQDAFRQGHDIHSATAAGIYGTGLDEVTQEQRRYAKMVNFGIVYGISAFGLSERLGIPRWEAATIIEGYFEQYPGIRQFMDDQTERARSQGYVETMLGRRRYLRDINSGNSVMRQFAERNAINAPIQGTSADMIKIAMLRIHRAFEERQIRSLMIMQVHDELVFDVYRDELEEVVPLIVEGMQQALPLSVPVGVDVKSGDNWLEAH
jgi:DNA polymerase I